MILTLLMKCYDTIKYLSCKIFTNVELNRPQLGMIGSLILIFTYQSMDLENASIGKMP